MANVKINGILLNDGFSKLVEVLTELNKISDNAKLKISDDEILLYSTEGVDNAIHVLKTYQVNTNAVFEFKNPIKNEMSFVFNNIKSFISHVKFLDTTKKINMQFTVDSDNCIVFWKISDGVFEFSDSCSKGFKIRDLKKSQIETLLDTDNSNWTFKIGSSILTDIKRLCKLNSESLILNISNNNGVVKFLESGKWKLEVAKSSVPVSEDITITKKYFYSIDVKMEFAELFVFDHFILFKDENTNLMISFEQNL